MRKNYLLIPALCAGLVLSYVLFSNRPYVAPAPDGYEYGPHGEDPVKWAEFCDCSEDYGDIGVEECYHEIFGVWVDAYSTYTDSLVILDEKPTHEIPY